MLISFRLYATVYTLLALAWIAAFPMIGACTAKTTSRYMMIVAGTASVVAALNIIDWLWS